MSDSFAQEFERLGLFKTRVPRFTQLFFHDFYKHEVTMQIGQSFTPAVSRRAAKAFPASGARLYSKCGLSDVWYYYVETHQHLFEDPRKPSRSILELHHPRPGLDVEYAPAIYDVFGWYKHHTRPQPTKKVPMLIPSTPLSTRSTSEDVSSDDNEADCSGTPSHKVSEEGGASEDNTYEFSSGEDGSLIGRRGRVSEVSDDGMDTSNNDGSDGVGDIENEASEEGGEGGEDISEFNGDKGRSLIGHNERVDGASDDGMDTSSGDERDGFEDYILEFESWSASFAEAMVQSAAPYETSITAPPMPVSHMIVPSSIPEERELYIGSEPLNINGSADDLGRVTGEEKVVASEDSMEGVELSQPTEGRTTNVPDEDNEDVSEDDGHPGNSKRITSYSHVWC
jgi:hypothetical protein